MTSLAEPDLPRTLPHGLLAAAEGYHHTHVTNGQVIAFSDAHFSDLPPTTAFRALIHHIEHAAEDGVLRAVVNVGDVLDLPTVGRHPPLGWGDLRNPSVARELEVAQERLAAIVEAAGPGVEFPWCLGNHDLRWAQRLAQVAPEFAGCPGMELADHFPAWDHCMLLEVNPGPGSVVFKHRFTGSANSTRNDTLRSGKSLVCGHSHALNVTAYSDYNGIRYGCNSGTLAAPYSRPFAAYTELNPVDWRSGFLVFTFVDGILLPPEPVIVMSEVEGIVAFRGELLRVGKGP